MMTQTLNLTYIQTLCISYILAVEVQEAFQNIDTVLSVYVFPLQI